MDMLKTFMRTGVMGGPAKIHQMFLDYREPESQPPASPWAEITICVVAAIAGVACLLFIPDDPSTKR
jgi:hypothetical protein